MYQKNLKNRTLQMIIKSSVIIRLRDYYVDKKLKLRYFQNRYRYDAEIDPLQLYYINPCRISQSMKLFDKPKWKIAGRVTQGDWDIATQKFSQLDGSVHFHVLDSFEDHFKRDVPWEQTKFYQKVLKEIENDRIWWGCANEKDLRTRCQRINKLYDIIKTEGYKTQKELRESSDPPKSARRPEAYRKINGEIAINIGRNGEPIFYDGRNRLSIAKILELDSIPVVILARHKQWQDIRDRIVSGRIVPWDLPSEIKQHPDIKGLV